MEQEVLDLLLKEKKIIFSYLRNENRKKIGMLVAWISQDKIRISYSLLNPEDKFSKLQGIQVAIDKSYHARNSLLLSSNKVFDITHELSHFIHRCAQYFKSSDFNIHVPIVQRKLRNVEPKL